MFPTKNIAPIWAHTGERPAVAPFFIEMTNTVRFTVQLPEALNAWLEERATANSRSKSAEIACLLKQLAQPKQYEYRHDNPHLQRRLNEAGRSGWRLAAIGPNYDGIYERVKDD